MQSYIQELPTHTSTTHRHLTTPPTPTGSLILTSCVLSEEQVSRFPLLACCLVAWTAGICTTNPFTSQLDDDDDDDKDDDDCLLQDDISTSSSSKPTLTHHPRPHSLTLILERAGSRGDSDEQDDDEGAHAVRQEHLAVVGGGCSAHNPRGRGCARQLTVCVHAHTWAGK